MAELNPEDPTVRWAAFGRQVELFLDSDIGKYLVKKAQAQSAQAMEELVVADPNDPKLIASIQNRIKVADSIIEWLGDAIAEGHSAIQILKEEHNGQ